MKKENDVVDFDSSLLSLQELIELYDHITDFLQYLENNKIENEEENNE